MTILVVDDSRIMRNIIKNTLGQHRAYSAAQCVDAADGVEALKYIESNPVDLLIVDWNMPKLNGLDLVKRLRADDRYVRLPIVMVTSEAAKYNVIEAVKAGVSDYLIKPVSDKALLEKIERVLPL